jgi:hypothetical protein
MLPFRSGRSLKRGASGTLFIALISVSLGVAAEAQQKIGKRGAKPKASASPGSNIPLPIGQEIKGLVLPDIDMQGHLRSRFESGTAKRLDAERIQFNGLKVTSFTPEDTIDLQIDLPVSIFDMNTRVLRSEQRTTIVRRDFTISGDAMEFSTVDRKGTLTGNVKMIINDKSTLAGTKAK